MQEGVPLTPWAVPEEMLHREKTYMSQSEPEEDYKNDFDQQ